MIKTFYLREENVSSFTNNFMTKSRTGYFWKLNDSDSFIYKLYGDSTFYISLMNAYYSDNELSFATFSELLNYFNLSNMSENVFFKKYCDYSGRVCFFSFEYYYAMLNHADFALYEYFDSSNKRRFILIHSTYDNGQLISKEFSYINEVINYLCSLNNFCNNIQFYDLKMADVRKILCNCFNSNPYLMSTTRKRRPNRYFIKYNDRY